MKRFLAGTLVVLAGLTITPSALAEPNTPPLTPTSFWFDCTTTLPVGMALDEPTDSTWSSTPPAKGLQDGNPGCFWPDVYISGANQPNPLYDQVYGGDYTGEVVQADLTLYGNDIAGSKTFDVAVIVDGERIADYTMEVGAQTGPTPTTFRFDLTLPGLDLPETLDPKKILFGVHSYYGDDGDGWFYASKDFPAGVKFYDSDDLPVEDDGDDD